MVWMVKIMKNNNIKYVIIIVVIVLIFTSIFLLLKSLTKNKTSDNFLKNYEVNEYITTYISDEDMAKIYLNDYIHIMFSDVERAYNLLNEEYRNKRFGNINNFSNYVKSLNYSSFSLSKYYVRNENGYRYFGVYDNNNNYFIFETDGVMQYTVYLDETTVEIW